MPQLKSGRHVAISASPYLDLLNTGTEDARHFAIITLRLTIPSPTALRDCLVVGYFAEGQGTPPNAPSYNSGYKVADILEGRSDWRADEVEEFRQFLAEPRVEAWLQAQYDEIDAAIRNHPIWQSEKFNPNVDHGPAPNAARANSARVDANTHATDSSSEASAHQNPELSSSREVIAPDVDTPSPSSAELPDELREFILAMAKRPDVHSVSCQFWDRKLWEGLLLEQVKRARASGKTPERAYFLCGPDSGIPGIAKHHPGLEDMPPEEWFNGDTLEEKLGGDIHIPYEGVCGADLFVYPEWRKIYPEAWQKEGAELDWATAKRPCNHLLIERDLGETPCATRVGPIAGTWWLYSSKAPYKPCSPSHVRNTE